MCIRDRAIGSGGPFANSAAKALIQNTNMDAKQIALESLNIAADICIYTNHNIIFEQIKLYPWNQVLALDK